MDVPGVVYSEVVGTYLHAVEILTRILHQEYIRTLHIAMKHFHIMNIV
jgi:hypothetical protein